jgi:hypothetical protein
MCLLVPFPKTWSSRISPLARWRTGAARVSRATLKMALWLLPATTQAATNVFVAFTTTNSHPAQHRICWFLHGEADQRGGVL